MRSVVAGTAECRGATFSGPCNPVLRQVPSGFSTGHAGELCGLRGRCLHLLQMHCCLSNFLMASWEAFLPHPHHVAGAHDVGAPLCDGLYHTHTSGIRPGSLQSITLPHIPSQDVSVRERHTRERPSGEGGQYQRQGCLPHRAVLSPGPSIWATGPAYLSGLPQSKLQSTLVPSSTNTRCKLQGDNIW